MKPFHYNQDPLYAAATSILKGHTLTENIVAFNNRGFKQLNGLMSDDEIHKAVNSTVKSAALKLNDRTWNIVTDIYGKRADGTWTGDWILQRKASGGRIAWLTIKDGGSFKAQDSIVDVLSFFEIEEDLKETSRVEATVVLQNGAIRKKEFPTQAAAEDWVKKTKEVEDVRNYKFLSYLSNTYDAKLAAR